MLAAPEATFLLEFFLRKESPLLTTPPFDVVLKDRTLRNGTSRFSWLPLRSSKETLSLGRCRFGELEKFPEFAKSLSRLEMLGLCLSFLKDDDLIFTSPVC